MLSQLWILLFRRFVEVNHTSIIFMPSISSLDLFQLHLLKVQILPMSLFFASLFFPENIICFMQTPYFLKEINVFVKPYESSLGQNI
jgi:hypothetical protein